MKTGILALVRKNKLFKVIAAFLAINILGEIVFPTVAFALTSGPAQEEFASFEPATTTDLVDLFSGDFTYNIPLLSVPGPNGGYPINLSYHSGVGMDQEASWVGLGWSLNVGAINRQLRGLPDDYKGDAVTHQMNLKDNVTVAIELNNAVKREIFGIAPKSTESGVGLQGQIYYNTYKGLGYRVFGLVSRELKNDVASMNMGISFDSQNGIGIEPDMSLNGAYKKSNFGFNAGASLNTRQGLQNFSFASNFSARNNERTIQTPFGGQKFKYNVGGAGASGQSAISFSTAQTVPSVSIPMRTTTIPFDIKIGREAPFGTFTSTFPGAWTGFVSTSKVENGGNSSTSAYGYLYTSSATESYMMKDFQRENISYSKNVPNLAPSSFTYDIYTQTGQGTGSMFRPYTSNVGILSDAKKSSTEKTHRINAEFGGPGPSYHLGLGYTQTSGSTSSGSWEKVGNNPDNNLNLDFSTSSGAANYEPVYFQVYGEKTGSFVANDQIAAWSGDQAVRVKLDKDNDNSWFNRQFIATNEFVQSESGPTIFSAGTSQHYKNGRQKRSTNIEALTDDEAVKYGYSKQLTYKDIPTNAIVGKDFSHGSKISEMSVLQPDGMRYVYGLPAYNNTQMDAVFSVDGSSRSFNDSRVPVPNNNNGSIAPSGANGSEQLLSETDMNAAYAHSWLLTQVVSSDYIDRTDNGPTDDDYGYWVKFNYIKTASNFKWRVPYTDANFMEGNKDHSDDKGSFAYGEKEIYFLQSIETKTHIAVFNLSDREDGIDAYAKIATSLPIQRGTNRMKKLDAISLYTKTEYYLPSSPTVNPYAVPIKTAHFNYSYKLCGGVDNNSGIAVNVGNQGNINAKHGKLTLEKLYFTYLNSFRGELSPYKFDYGNTSSQTDNPDYSSRQIDRWGNFKLNPGSSNYPSIDFPYTNQDNGMPNVAVWSLKQIQLPTGGTLRVGYESDDYAYVENKKAMRMFDIVGLNSAPTSNSLKTDATIQEIPTEDITNTNAEGNFRVYFKLEKDLAELSGPERKAYILQHYLNGISKVYFKTFIKLTNSVDDRDKDYVSGYAELSTNGTDDYGVDAINTNIGYITLKAEKLNKINLTGKMVNPFTKAAIQHLRVNRPELIHNASGSNSTDAMTQITNLLGSISTFFNDITAAISSFNVWAYSKGFGQTISLNGRSIIRLDDPDGKKYGGGVRVASLTISDNWDGINQNISNSTTDPSVYGQTYDYTIKDEFGNSISSGVAYEPQIGAEESALRTPIEYGESTPLSTTNNLFLENPILQSYYPGASVGYRKVTVKSIAPTQADIEDDGLENNSTTLLKSASPLTIYEFYTAKEFPVICDETDMNADPAILRPIIIPGILSNFKKRKARSQGYSVVLNDMNGKLKSITQLTLPTVGNPTGKLVSKEEYLYNTTEPYSQSNINQLSSKVQVLNSEATYQTGLIGQSHDIFIDMNENLQKSKTRGLDANLDILLHLPFPFFIMPLPYIGNTEVSMRSVVTMKVIYRTGIVKKIITTSDESTITKENLAFDIETGEPLLTKVTNEYNDPVYNTSYPAHWYYLGMGGSYNNWGVNLTGLTVTANTVSRKVVLPPTYQVDELFSVGDEVFVTTNTNDHFKAHVYDLNSTGSNNYIRLVKLDGTFPGETINEIKVIVSGRKNLLNSKAGTLTAKELNGFNSNVDNPIPNPANYNFDKRIDASAVEYKERWDIICDACGSSSYTSDWIIGKRGIWRPYQSYVYQTNRTSVNNIQSDGYYADFVAFPWMSPSTKNAKWVRTNTITQYSPYGFEIENMDAVGNYSSALYGYSHSLVTAVAKNAQYKEVAFDGFEDYGFSDCENHLNFKTNAAKVSSQEAHTGKSSIKLAPGEKVEAGTLMIDNCVLEPEPAPADVE